MRSITFSEQKTSTKINLWSTKNILGSGKIFEPVDLWAYEPVGVVFPWEKAKPAVGGKVAG